MRRAAASLAMAASFVAAFVAHAEDPAFAIDRELGLVHLPPLLGGSDKMLLPVFDPLEGTAQSH